MSSFPPVIIDTSAPTPPAISAAQERPVYVYGKSGQCWKFNNKENADKYFDDLTYKSVSPQFLSCAQYLIDHYGESILERLRQINVYKNPPVFTKSDYVGEITHAGKSVPLGIAQKYTYFYKKANISITCNKHYEVYSTEPLNQLFPESMRRWGIMHMFIPLPSDVAEHERAKLRNDYVLGDRVRYTEPRQTPTTATSAAAVPRPSWRWFLLGRTQPTYERIQVGLHLD